MSEIATAPIDIRSGPRGPQPRVSGKGVLVQAIATLSYYHDHREEMERLAREDDEFVEEMKRDNPSLLDQKLRERFGR